MVPILRISGPNSPTVPILRLTLIADKDVKLVTSHQSLDAVRVSKEPGASVQLMYWNLGGAFVHPVIRLHTDNITAHYWAALLFTVLYITRRYGPNRYGQTRTFMIFWLILSHFKCSLVT